MINVKYKQGNVIIPADSFNNLVRCWAELRSIHRQFGDDENAIAHSVALKGLYPEFAQLEALARDLYNSEPVQKKKKTPPKFSPQTAAEKIHEGDTNHFKVLNSKEIMDRIKTAITDTAHVDFESVDFDDTLESLGIHDSSDLAVLVENLGAEFNVTFSNVDDWLIGSLTVNELHSVFLAKT